jgi:endonuclease/exonuclease/phosphatase family metal-dependent hydrolase
MRIVLYNMRYGTGGGFCFPWQGYLRHTTPNVNDIAAFLAALNPDIVGLVEVDAGSFRFKRFHQAEEIATKIGHYHAYRSKYQDGSWMHHVPVLNKQGNAFLTKDTIQQSQFHFFNRGMKRLVIELELEGVVVFLVHLALKYRVRQQQMTELYELVKSTQKPHLVIGDFNAFFGPDELHLFLGATGMKTANTKSLPTYPSWNPKRELDFIFYSAGIQVSDFSIPNVTYSDHLPLVCDFDLS